MTLQHALILTHGDLTCAFGESGIGWLGPHHCHRCAAVVAEACAQFDRDVRTGKYDAEGYTPKDRRKQRKRAQ